MVQCGSMKTGVRTKTTVYNTDNHNLTSIFSNGGLCKKAYGNEDNQKKPWNKHRRNVVLYSLVIAMREIFLVDFTVN
jgi:hypothetical protein